jgi:hypothetical protein
MWQEVVIVAVVVAAGVYVAYRIGSLWRGGRQMGCGGCCGRGGEQGFASGGDEPGGQDRSAAQPGDKPVL